MEWWDWVRDNMWLPWASLAAVLGVAELFSLDLVLLMLAVGAVVGVVAALLEVPVPLQVLAAVASSVAMLALVRPGVVKKLHGGPELTLGHNALVGKQAVVIGEVSAQSGQIKVGGEVWTARPYDETAVIAPGATVDVLEIRGATAMVYEVPTLGS